MTSRCFEFRGHVHVQSIELTTFRFRIALKDV